MSTTLLTYRARAPYRNPAATGYIHGLDGLRAIAVLLVLVYHLWPELLPGGFLGVDVFFVISGFLITTLLLREHDRDGSIDIADFWRRRARRILPAMVTVVVVSVAVARLVSSDLLVDIGRQVLGAFTFSTNWVEVAAGTDYFDQSTAALLNPLWSLAVEEQFYLVWPVVFTLLASAGLAAHRLSRIMRVGALLSAALMALLYVEGQATRVYYGTDTHLFGLLLGAAAAYAMWDPASRFARRSWQRLRLWLGFAATVVLVVLTFVLRSDVAATYRGGILLASLCAVAMVTALPGSATAYARVLEQPQLRWIGQRSYGIYLWHWPILLIVEELRPPLEPGASLDLVTAAIVVVLTLVVSEASFRLLETPIRNQGWAATVRALREALCPDRGGLATPVAASAAFTLVGGLAVVGVVTAPERSSAQVAVETGQELIAAQAERPAAAAPAAAWSPDLAVPPGDVITGLGDSVLSGAAPALYERFPGILLDAAPILQWREAPDMVRRVAQHGDLRPAVVLNFGTNAGLKHASSLTAMREVLDLLGPERRVVLVTVVGVSYWIPETNATYRQVAADYPNVAVADWHAVVARDPGLLHSDETHPNLEGIGVYADLIARTFEQLGPG